MTRINANIEQYDRYTDRLLFDQLVNSFSSAIFTSFKIMLVNKQVLDKDKKIDDILEMRFNIVNKTSVNLNNFDICFFINKLNNLVFELRMDNVLIKNAFHLLYLRNYSQDNLGTFLSLCVNSTLNEFLELTNNDALFKVELTNIDTKKESVVSEAPVNCFMKKIARIDEDGTLSRYRINFDDNSTFMFMMPAEYTLIAGPGDFGYFDENHQFSFLHRENVQ